mgnify:CR=1 FL=1
MAKRIDMTGWKIWEHGVPDSRLTVLSVSNCRAADGSIKWMCRCSCGNICEVSSCSIRSGKTLSCGCYKREKLSKAHKSFNKYDLSGAYGVGYDSKGNTFCFDIEDYDKISNICWHIEPDGRVVGYKSGKPIRMHKIITNTTSEVIDHINNKPWDNRKCNLRLSDKQTNGINRGCNKNNKLGVKGVNKATGSKKFTARIMVNGKTIYLGLYDTIEEAKAARDKAEQEYFGEFAYKGGEDIT